MPGDSRSKRLVMPISEREKEMVKQATAFQNLPTFPKNKVSQWLGEPNVKAFNKILLEKAFMKHFSLTEPEVLRVELMKYFECCYDNEIVPTISSMSVWLGVNKDTIYSNITNKSNVADVLSQAVNFCHSLNENGAISGTINSVLYMFLSKNYYGMQDNSTLNLTTGLQDTTVNNTNTMKVIQEQLALEHTNKNELNMSNINETE